MPAIIMIAAMGLKCGTQTNAARAATARAVSTATTAISRAVGRRPSKATKKGTMAYRTMSVPER